MASFRLPQFLTEADHPRFRVRCPVHGFIHFSENERRIVDHRLFRRLRHIKQLALTEYLYPGATHSRFEHSLGVMELATRAFDRLAAVRGDLLESTFREVAGFEDQPLALARQVLRLAALLHDVGHAPFSHAAEAVIHAGSSHEALTVSIICDAELMGDAIRKRFGQDSPQSVARLIHGGPELAPQLQILGDIISGQMDADRTDYLLRDSLHCGVEYGRFDYRRMIESLALDEGPASSLQIALDRGGIHTFEALILARYQMNTQVYYHRVRRIYDLYLRNYFDAKGRDWLDTPEKILAQNDVTAMAEIFRDAEGDDESVRKWASRIRDRRHHRLVHETGENTNAFDLGYSGVVFERLQQEFPDLDFQWDHADASIHKLLVPDDLDADGLVRLPVITAGGHKRPLGEQSHILRRVPRRFQIARIFCDLPADDLALKSRIQQFAVAEYHRQGGRS
ncbi:MAG: HD domain-containing protein [Planctomycetes bacterium]|nr:HD domain-containing protein [Planctomycetota bacterium]